MLCNPFTREPFERELQLGKARPSQIKVNAVVETMSGMKYQISISSKGEVWTGLFENRMIWFAVTD